MKYLARVIIVVLGLATIPLVVTFLICQMAWIGAQNVNQMLWDRADD